MVNDGTVRNVAAKRNAARRTSQDVSVDSGKMCEQIDMRSAVRELRHDVSARKDAVRGNVMTHVVQQNTQKPNESLIKTGIRKR